MLDHSTPIRAFPFSFRFMLQSVISAPASLNGLVAGGAFICLLAISVCGQADSQTPPVVVQPGAPGETTRTLPPTTRAQLPPRSAKDAEFMQKMIMHHAQAVEMTALIESRTENKAIRLLGARISKTQADEINFMKRWLEVRGEPISPPSHGASDMDSSSHHMNMSSHHHMPGMLTPKQMAALRNAKGTEFDRLFLTGMIQHHDGALVMVKELFDTPGAGQDAELFNFANDVDDSQRAEIRIMQTLLGEKP